MPPPSLEGAQYDPRKTKVVKTSESRFSANSSVGKQTLQKKEDTIPAISRLPNPFVSLSGLVVPFLLLDCYNLIKLPVFSLGSELDLRAFQLPSEKPGSS
ncbi:hypothetical protein TNIN_446051 [Trichonephila inaurata madagascariensis]|uniref:Uncharacterized protein n=1 Tax=Trichonephila inaurata madagascariensis TaxID=2747483 RepID=A0A8X6JB65_9ARAC|nr:hypothetical protein TNIN_446051 [Trichonephila inaurata madagascariensis]